MNKQQPPRNIWAATDKSAIDMMTQKTCQLPSNLSTNDSINDNSDVESLDSFVAVPREFRPPLPVRRNIEHQKFSLNENKQLRSNQNPIPVYKNTSKETVPKIPVLENPNPASAECKRVSNTNEMPVHKKAVNFPKHAANLQKTHQVTNDTTKTCNIDVKKISSTAQKSIFQSPEKMINSFQKHGTSRHKEMIHNTQRNDTHVTKNDNEIKYEYVEKKKTVKVNFEMPPTSNLLLKNGSKINDEKNLKEQQKDKQNLRTKAVKVFYDGAGYTRNKNEHTISCEATSGVKWVQSLNPGERTRYTEDKPIRDFNKVAHGVKHKKNAAKWISCFDIKNKQNGIEHNSGENAHKVYERKVKWVSSLNLEDSSSDSEDKIEWTIIQEKKTIVSAKKIENQNHKHKEIDNKFLPRKPCTQNKFNRVRNYRHKNYTKHSTTNHQKHAQKHHPPNDKKTENAVYKNDLQLNNTLQYERPEIEKSNIRKECKQDNENFNQKCAIIEENSDSEKFSLQLQNDELDFAINSNAKQIFDCQETNSYPEKTDDITLKHIEDQKDKMLYYGREMADIIIGSYDALSMFISIFKEWKKSRLELINYFEYLEKNLKESSKKFTKFNDVLNLAKTGASLAVAVPLPHVSIAARVISVFASLFSVFLSNKENKSGEVEEANDITIAAERDTNASTELYMFGLQCGQQFEETAKLIEEFHSNAGDPVIFEKDSPEIATFIRGVLEYKPRHRIFLTKFHKCFQELLHRSASEFGRKFCEPFLLYSSNTIDVIGFLNWRFRHEDFNSESVRFELKEIERIMENNDTSLKELTTRVQNCIAFLKDELKFLEGCMKDFTLFEKLL